MICPNINSPEWKALEAAVGRFEAYKDFVISGYTIRSVEDVQARLNQDKGVTIKDETLKVMSGNVTDVNEVVFHSSDTTFVDAVKEHADQSMTTRAMEIARKLSDNLGVSFDIINGERALEITKDSKNPWNGQAAFYFDGQVYFVGESLSINSVLHEFSHPLVRQIQVTNPALFNNLYNSLARSAEGQAIIQELMEDRPDLTVSSDMFKEEAMVRALEIEASTSNFAKFIKDILYAIKKLLRDALGKVDVAKLDQYTTLNELAYMLTNEKFQIDTDLVTEEDVVAYMKATNDDINSIKRIDKLELQSLLREGYDLASSQLRTLQQDDNYKQLAIILRDQYKVPDMENIMSDLRKYKTQIDNIVDNEVDAMALLEKQASALVNTIYNVDTIMRKIQAHSEDIFKSGDTQDNMAKMHYYQKLTKYWGKYINQVKEIFDQPGSGVDSRSSIYNVINSIKTNLDKIDNLANEMYADGARDALYTELEPIGRNAKDSYEQIIRNLKAKDAPQRVIDKWHREFYGLSEADFKTFSTLRDKVRKREYMSNAEKLQYANLRVAAAQGIEITPEKIEDLLKGNLGDANWFNSFLEGYMYNNDPIVGGLALYVKNRLNEVMVTAQSKFNEFQADVMPLLKEYGYNPSNIGELGKKVGFEDIVAKEEDGKLVQKKVWSFLNPFKNYRYDLRVINNEVEEAERKYSETGLDEDLDTLRDAVTKKKEFLRKYFHQEYKPEFYERQQLLERDEVGQLASHMRDSILEKIRKASVSNQSQSDQLEAINEIDRLWREYRQLHSLYDLNGEAKTGTPLLIAQRLREYREASRRFYEMQERPGVFQNLLEAYEQELQSKFPKGSDEYEALREEWIRKNTRVVIKPSFYAKREVIFDRIKEILSKLPDQTAKQLDIATLHEAIIDIKAGFRDEDGQPNPSEMTEAAINKIKELEAQIQEKKKLYRNTSGFTAVQQARFNELFEIKKTRSLTAEESTDFGELYSEKLSNGLSRYEKAKLDALYKQLENLSTTDATSYYVDIVNNYLEKMDTDLLYSKTGSRSITESTAGLLLEDDIIADLKSQNKAFAKWFDANHITVEYSGKSVKKRVSVWSVVRPTDDMYYEKTQIKDASGRVVEEINGLPAMKFYKQNVKEEFKTAVIVGKTVDNKGNWLPKTMEDGAADDRYINKDYFTLRSKDPKLFEIVEKLKEHHLRNQLGLEKNSKLYLDFPRFTKGTLETVQSTKLDEFGREKWNGLTQYAKRVKEFFKGAKDDAESGYNYQNEANLVKLDMFDDEVTNIPISGLYDIDSEDVSTDITQSMMRYMLSAERHKKLVQISPLARAIQQVVNDPDNTVELDKINKFNFVNRHIITYKKKKGTTVRASAVNNFLEREFQGIKNKGVGSDSRALNNISKVLFSRASFQFFALNIPSALKNHYSAKFQTMIEAAAGKYLNPVSSAKGEAWAMKTMGDLSFGGALYGKKAAGLDLQIVEIFDPAQGRFQEKFGESLSRSMTKDVVEGGWLYSTRKWLELQATLQAFGGMMYHQKVQQKLPDGTTEEINYMDAWEIKDDKIQLKEGIDPKWGITYDENGNLKLGSEFNAFKNRMQQVMNNLQGTYSEFDQPEAQRYIAFRFVSYLRRYFTSMTINRLGFKGSITKPQARLNPGLGEPSMGYYIRTLQGIKTMIVNADITMKYLTAEEKQAMIKTLTEIAGLIAVTLALGMIFGYDDDDEERYEKLRQTSGALPFFMVADDDERQFDALGYTKLHILNLLMQVRAENEQFLPVPGVGLDNYMELLDLKSVAFGPTTDTYTAMIDDMIAIIKSDEHAYYSRDTGPYEFQRKGGNKLVAKIAKLVGFTGSTIDPATAIQKFQNAQAMARR